LIVDLHLKGNLVIVIGAGNEGVKKVKSLLTQDCKILVISNSTNSQISKLVKEKKIKFKKLKLVNTSFLTKYKPYLVMATTDDKKLNHKIVNAAKKLNCYAYASDDPEISDFAHPSIINIEDTVQIAISTGGRSPVMAKKLKTKSEKFFRSLITKEDLSEIKLQKFARDIASKKLDSQIKRKKFLYTILNDKRVKELLKDGKHNSAKTKVKKMLGEWK